MCSLQLVLCGLCFLHFILAAHSIPVDHRFHRAMEEVPDYDVSEDASTEAVSSGLMRMAEQTNTSHPSQLPTLHPRVWRLIQW